MRAGNSDGGAAGLVRRRDVAGGVCAGSWRLETGVVRLARSQPTLVNPDCSCCVGRNTWRAESPVFVVPLGFVECMACIVFQAVVESKSSGALPVAGSLNPSVCVNKP